MVNILCPMFPFVVGHTKAKGNHYLLLKYAKKEVFHSVCHSWGHISLVKTQNNESLPPPGMDFYCNLSLRHSE